MKFRALWAIPALALMLGGDLLPAQEIQFQPAIMTADTQVQYVDMGYRRRRRHHRHHHHMPRRTSLVTPGQPASGFAVQSQVLT